MKKNYFLQLSYQILNMMLPFVTSPYIARVLGATQLGIYSYTYSITSIFVLFINLGIEKYGSRTIATVKESREKLNRTFSEIFFIHLILGVTVSFIYGIFVSIVSTNKIYYAINFFLLLGAIFDVNWFFFGMEKFKVTVTRNFVFKIVTVACVFIFVKNADDLWKYIAVMTVGTMLSQSAIWIVLPKYVSFVKIEMNKLVKHLKPMLVLFLAVLASSAYTYIDKIMIGSLANMEQLGFCDNAYKVIAFPLGIITSLGVIMLPRMAVLFASDDKKQIDNYISKSMKFVMILSIGMCGGMMAVGKPFAILFWGKAFETSGIIISIIAPIVIFMSWSDVIRNQFLIPKKMDKEYSSAIIIGAIVNLFFNAILIPYLGAYGAAIGTIVSYFSIAFYQTFVTRKELNYFVYLKSSVPYMLFSIVMVISIRILQQMLPKISILGLIAQILLGVIIYLSLVVGYMLYKKDEFLAAFTEKIPWKK